jgi:hypothetical protein
MPRKAKLSRPSEFVSDGEDDGYLEQNAREEQSTTSPLPFLNREVHGVSHQRPRSPVRVIPVTRVSPASVSEDNFDNSDPPAFKKEGSDIADLANLVLILNQTNASVKGRIDDTGRFELKFNLNHQKVVGGDTPSLASSSARRSSDASARKKIGWIRTSN